MSFNTHIYFSSMSFLNYYNPLNANKLDVKACFKCLLFSQPPLLSIIPPPHPRPMTIKYAEIWKYLVEILKFLTARCLSAAFHRQTKSAMWITLELWENSLDDRTRPSLVSWCCKHLTLSYKGSNSIYSTQRRVFGPKI